MANWKDPEFLRYVSLAVVGLIVVVWGIVGFLASSQLSANLPAAIPRITTDVPEALPAVQSIQSSLGAIQILSVVSILAGLLMAASGILSIKEMQKQAQPAWSYYAGSTPEQPRPSQ